MDFADDGVNELRQEKLDRIQFHDNKAVVNAQLS